MEEETPTDDVRSGEALKEKWCDIMRRASEEKDPARLLELSRELYQSMLEEEERRRKLANPEAT